MPGRPPAPSQGRLPDASCGLDKDNFSTRWTGRLLAPATGAYTLHGDCDGVLRVWIDETQVIDKGDHRRREVQGTVELTGGRTYQVRVDYVYRVGAASNHLSWSGPRLSKRVLQPDGDGAIGLPGSP